MLTRLVAAFGPGNWNAMSKMIPGRTGKSCRFRWVNHLDPSVKRGPFSDEEDRVILTAHQIHGNKWKSISKMLPGRTGYAIKNHWNVSLKNKQADQRSPDLSASDMTAAQILSEMKAFTQKALSFGDVVTSGNQEEGEGGDYHGHQNYEDQAFQAKEGCVAAGTRENPPVLRPKASYGAFSVYYPPSGGPGNNSGALTVVPLQGPLAQALGSEFGIHHFLEDAHGEPLIPHQCGYGCCSGQNGPNGGSSLLGPEFIDYIESPSSSQELMSLAAELNEIAWAQCDLPSDPGPSDLPADVSTGMLSMEMRQPTRPSENKNDPCGKLKGVKQ
ncbi:transcription factor MYB25 [Eucalyptus grandis]|uniref:transcription factor MYB25 n=1 Tax=Eucalyptus grandis TaxID=71139 RepID=UPI00192F085F|nr:transcription factor MYB25 [Eucalyptus grandis]